MLRIFGRALSPLTVEDWFQIIAFVELIPGIGIEKMWIFHYQ